jgi:general L-amino acid transport system substrate-binding protein
MIGAALVCSGVASAAEPRASETVAAIRAKGALTCGVNEGLTGFGQLSSTGDWRGFDVDICRAIAAVILGDATKVDFVPLSAADRFPALTDRKVDVLSRNTTWTMQRDADLALRFPAVSYYDGQGFMARAETGLVSAQQFDGRTVCVLAGTTSEANLSYFFSRVGAKVTIQTFGARADMLSAYLDGRCDGYSADRSALFADRVSFPNPTDHAVLPETISKEPLGPVVRDDDAVFGDIVGWTLFGLINAEEAGLTQAMAQAGSLTGDARRLAEGADAAGLRLGLKVGWLTRAVGAVGHYGEMFETNLGRSGPLGMMRGMNALWTAGGILYAPPM